MKKVMIWVEGEPQGKGRPRFSTRNGFATAYTPKKTSDYEKLIAHEYIRSADCEMFLGEVSVEINAYFDIPKSTTKKKRKQIIEENLMPQKKPDIDNIAKIVLDALNGVGWQDDKQVVQLTTTKYYAHNDRAGVEIIISDWS